MPRYAELIYNGFWFSPEREMLQAAIDKSQEHVEGEVRLKLYKGNVMRHRPREPEVALFRQRSSPSRTTRAPTTRRTPPASSSSTRCACARSASATGSASAAARKLACRCIARRQIGYRAAGASLTDVSPQGEGTGAAGLGASIELVVIH